MSAILREQPPVVTPDVGTLPALSRIIRRCLEKTPDDRFQSARDLRFVLEEVSEAAGASPVRRQPEVDATPSIAVLPFTDMSAQRDQAYFCEGMAEETRSTSADLGQIAAVLVPSHSARWRPQNLACLAATVEGTMSN